MENFQRYFLMFSILIFSYFLLIRWDPPANDTNQSLVINKSERSLISESSEFIEAETFNENLSVSETSVDSCSLSNIKTLKSPYWSLDLDLKNGEIVKTTLENYPTEMNSSDRKVLFNKCGPEKYSQVSGFEFLNKDLAFKENLFSIKDMYKSDGKNFVVLEKRENDLIFSKTFSYKNDDYFVSVKDNILNLSGKEITFAPYSKIDRSDIDLYAEDSSIFNPASFAYLGPAFQTSSDNYNKISFSDLSEESYRELSSKGWVSMLEHYFISAIIPEEGSNLIFQARKSSKSGIYSVGVVGETSSIGPNKEASFDQKVYFGPKIKKELQKTHPELDLAVDYGWLWWIGQPMYSAMVVFFDLTGNWGWSIVLVTILIKLLLWPLSMVSYRNMGKMRAVQPKMQEIQERHADDRQALSKAMMDLYKKEKVNPALGCLPMLMQMPFFLAFYWVLIETVELRYAPFLFWITDLSARDPLFILPILNMAAMWGMQQLQPQPVGADPIQANVFKYMPLIFGVMFALFPAGLVLYWFLNSLVSAVQMVMHGPKKAKISS
ncbi:membrane protein insertase YidC [Gammaproteobacteria bacterium]|nr:membrane protein insertase YidC [Gammaproteobacteria bacterium]